MNLKFLNYSNIQDICKENRSLVVRSLFDSYGDDIRFSGYGNSLVANLGKGRIVMFFNLLLLDCAILFRKDGKMIQSIDVSSEVSLLDLLEKVYVSIANTAV